MKGYQEPTGFRHARFSLFSCIGSTVLPVVLTGCNHVRAPLFLKNPETTSVLSNTVQVDVANATQSRFSPDVEKQSESLQHFVAGQLDLNEENYQGALENFVKSEEQLQEPAPILHSKMADLYLRFGELEKALVSANKALSEDSSDPHVRLLYAGVLEALGRNAEAEPLYTRLIEESPGTFDAYVLLSHLYAKQSNYEAAVVTLRSLIRYHPQETIGHYYLGRMYEQMEKLHEAEVEYSRVLELESSSSSGQAELLRVLLKQKKSEQARALCDRILEKDPSNALARKVVSHIMLGESQFDGALEHLMVLEKLEEDASDTRFKIALIQIEKRNYKEALRELNLVLAKNPKHAEARYYLATILASSGETKEAVKELFAIPKDSPMFVRSRTFAAYVLRQDGKHKQALSAVQEGLSVEPNNINLALYEVVVLRDLERYKEAEARLRERLFKAPQEERLLFNLGLVLGDQAKVIESVQVMEQLIAINPRHSDALNFAAYELAESGGDLARAHMYASRAIELKPKDGFYLDTLGWIQFKQGKLPEAEQVLEQAVAVSGEDCVVVEHYVEVLIATRQIGKAVAIARSALERTPSQEELRDEDKMAAYKRIRKRLDSLLTENPQFRTPEVGGTTR